MNRQKLVFHCSKIKPEKLLQKIFTRVSYWKLYSRRARTSSLDLYERDRALRSSENTPESSHAQQFFQLQWWHRVRTKPFYPPLSIENILLTIPLFISQQTGLLLELGPQRKLKSTIGSQWRKPKKTINPLINSWQPSAMWLILASKNLCRFVRIRRQKCGKYLFKKWGIHKPLSIRFPSLKNMSNMCF